MLCKLDAFVPGLVKRQRLFHHVVHCTWYVLQGICLMIHSVHHIFQTLAARFRPLVYHICHSVNQAVSRFFLLALFGFRKVLDYRMLFF